MGVLFDADALDAAAGAAMNRRKFLAASLAATTGGILVAADLLSTKTFFLPPAAGWRPQIPIVYGRSWLDDALSSIQVRVTSGMLGIGDLVSMNGTPYRVMATRDLSGGIGGPSVVELDLVSDRWFEAPERSLS